MPIRLKITVISIVSTLVVLGGAGLLFLTTLASGLQNNLDAALRSRADDLASQVNPDGSLVRPGTEIPVRLAGTGFGQVLTPQATVLDTTESTLPRPLLTAEQLRQVGAGGHFFDMRIPEASTDPNDQNLRILAMPLDSGKNYVAVATVRDVVDQAVDRAGRQLLVLGGVVILLAGWGGWLLSLAALRPVERMRAQAAELQARDLGGGLSVPKNRDEIGRLAETLNALLGRLHGALERERSFVADAGHELRTPLTVLKGELELARRPGRTHEELLDTVGVAAEETERLIRLAESLLVLARDEAAGAHWSSFDLAELIDSAVNRASLVAAEREVPIETRGLDRLAVRGDQEQIRQVVDNVLVNALRFAPAGTPVTVRYETRGTTARIEISDCGPGFPPEFLPHAFERFRRGDAVRTRSPFDAGAGAPGGTGLGLAIVRTLLRGHGGDATVANRADGGARVTMWWPFGDGLADRADTGP